MAAPLWLRLSGEWADNVHPKKHYETSLKTSLGDPADPAFQWCCLPKSLCLACYSTSAIKSCCDLWEARVLSHIYLLTEKIQLSGNVARLFFSPSKPECAFVLTAQRCAFLASAQAWAVVLNCFLCLWSFKMLPIRTSIMLNPRIQHDPFDKHLCLLPPLHNLSHITLMSCYTSSSLLL